MKRTSPRRRAAEKAVRNKLMRALPGDREELRRFVELLKDPLTKQDPQAAYEKHYPKAEG